MDSSHAPTAASTPRSATRDWDASCRSCSQTTDPRRSPRSCDSWPRTGPLHRALKDKLVLYHFLGRMSSKGLPLCLWVPMGMAAAAAPAAAAPAASYLGRPQRYGGPMGSLELVPFGRP